MASPFERFRPQVARAALARVLAGAAARLDPLAPFRAQSAMPNQGAPSTGGPNAGGLPRLISLDASGLVDRLPNRPSTDSQYLRHEFSTWQGWYHWPDGWSPKRTREAVSMHLKGWPYMSAALAVDLPKYPPIFGALLQRTAPPLRTTWKHVGPDRAPGRFAVDDLDQTWREQFRPDYEDTLRTLGLMGGQWFHVHHVPDASRGVELPRLKRWPWEAAIWRGASPAYPGGWYAITIDSGLVRMIDGDGHWFYVSHGRRSHEMGAVIALGMSFVSGELARRDEAGLSEAAGRAAPWVELPQGVKVEDEIGVAVQAFVEEFGLARIGGVVPHGTQLKEFQIVSDTEFFQKYRQSQLVDVALALLGQAATLVPGATGVYQPLATWSVADALADKDHEATVRGWQGGVVRPYMAINGQDYGPDDDPTVKLVGQRYADVNAKAKATSQRATLFANTVQAQIAVFDLEQAEVDELAAEMSTPTRKLKKQEKPPPGAAPGQGGPGGPPALPPPPNLAEGIVAKEDKAEEKPGT